MGSHWNPMLTSWNITIQLTSHDDLTEKSANGYHRKQKRFAAQFFSWNRRVSKYILTSFSFSEQIYLYDCSDQSGWHITPPNSEIICGRNVSTKVVCGIILFFEKKAMPKIWKKSWVPFRSYLLNSTANPAQFECKWAGLAVLFSR